MKKLVYVCILGSVILSSTRCSSYPKDVINTIPSWNFGYLSGFYTSCSLLGCDTLGVSLGIEGQYCEITPWGRLYGEWAPAFHFDNTDSSFVSIGIQLDSLISRHHMHYDGREKSFCWRNAMYYYSQDRDSGLPIVRLRDRTGQNVPIYKIVFRDSNQIVLKEEECVTESVIPKRTTYISVSGYDINLLHGVCNYTCDSGDVNFVILPDPNDHRLWFQNDRLHFAPYDSIGRWNKSYSIDMPRVFDEKK